MRQLRFVILVGCLVTLLVSPGRVAAAAAPAVESGGTLESLAFAVKDQEVVAHLQTTTPVPRFLFRNVAAGGKEIVLEVPGATSRLQPRYEVGSPLVPEVKIEAGEGRGGRGATLRFILGQAGLASLEVLVDGLLLRFEAGASGAAPAAAGTDYRVGVGDKLEITVFGHQDLSQTVEVRGDGTINVPLIGDQPAAGKTVGEVAAIITGILGRDYLVDPQVNVDVREYQSQWVNIIGEVRSPGRYVLKRNMRLIDLLAEAGGVTKEAGSDLVLTRRALGGESQRPITVSLEEVVSRNRPEANLLLQNGDIVAVQEKPVFYIRGEVNRPGAYVLDRGMTLLKAVSVAGGFAQFANPKEIELLRAGERGVSQRTVVNLKTIESGKKDDIPLRANDTIIVPRRIF